MGQLTLFEDYPRMVRRRSLSVDRLFIEDVGLDVLPGKGRLRGTRYELHCPFHTEKTPSFYLVFPSNQFVCYGCGVRGGPLLLLQEFVSEPVLYLQQKVGYDAAKEKQWLRQALEYEAMQAEKLDLRFSDFE